MSEDIRCLQTSCPEPEWVLERRGRGGPPSRQSGWNPRFWTSSSTWFMEISTAVKCRSSSSCFQSSSALHHTISEGKRLQFAFSPDFNHVCLFVCLHPVFICCLHLTSMTCGSSCLILDCSLKLALIRNLYKQQQFVHFSSTLFLMQS